jgi:membrane protein required for colicin V production
MNYLDILITIPVIIGAWKGFKKGFIIEIFTLMALLIGIYAGIHFSDAMAKILRENLSITTQYLPAIAFTITFLMVGAMVYFAGKLIEKALKLVALSTINKFAGLFFGAVKMLFFVSATLIILESYDSKGNFIPNQLKSESILFHPVKELSIKTIPALKYSDLVEKLVND